MYLENFKDKSNILQQFNAPANALDDAEVLLAWYGDGSYCGQAFVLFKKDGKLYEVNGSHCSCYGLEGQWEPEETSFEALSKRHDSDQYYLWGWDSYDGGEKAEQELNRIVKHENIDVGGAV